MMIAAPPEEGGRAQAAAHPPVSTPCQLDDELLSAARRALERHGVARATLERIAEEAGLSRVTLYRRGVTREAVLAALAGRALEDYRRAMWPALTARGSAAERLRRALGALCDVAEDCIELLLVLGARIAGARGDPVGNHEDAVRRTFTEPLERLLRDGAADGSLRGTDAPETATVLLNLVGWTYVHLRAGPKWSPRRAKRATLRIALRGVLAEPDGGGSAYPRGSRAMDGAEVIERLDLRPHPEGGHYRETFRHVPAGGGRGAMTAILYLLEAGEVSAWHRVDAAEIWHFHGGAPLALSISEDGRDPRTQLLGPDLATGEQPQVIVPAGAWQSAESRGAWTLVGCTVGPAFEFEGFELAPEGWAPDG